MFFFGFIYLVWTQHDGSFPHIKKDTKPSLHKHFYTQRPDPCQFLAIEPHFACKGCDWHPKIYRSFWRPTFISHVYKGCDWHLKIAILPQFLTSNVHFACKGCDWHLKITIFLQFLASNVHFACKGCDWHLKIAIFLQFLASNVHFVRKGCDGYLKIAI